VIRRWQLTAYNGAYNSSLQQQLTTTSYNNSLQQQLTTTAYSNSLQQQQLNSCLQQLSHSQQGTQGSVRKKAGIKFCSQARRFMPRGRCYDHNFLRFSTIFSEKIGVFLKNQCYDQNFA
jgi:hypothetical protein